MDLGSPVRFVSTRRALKVLETLNEIPPKLIQVLAVGVGAALPLEVEDDKRPADKDELVCPFAPEEVLADLVEFGFGDPGRVLIYRYFRARNARAAPTAMPRASRAISLARRWRFTYPLLSQAGGGSRQGYPGPVARSPYTFGASRSGTPLPPNALGHVLFTSAAAAAAAAAAASSSSSSSRASRVPRGPHRTPRSPSPSRVARKLNPGVVPTALRPLEGGRTRSRESRISKAAD
jgi:hypothetical protein